MNLYNKYKPKKFQEVKGQETICKILLAMCEKNQIPNAIIFTGNAGVGKTVLAHLFAKAINCLNENKPCNSCTNCLAIDNNSEDFIETDGATNTSIENVRKIQEHTRYFPMQLKYKVYLIDEVHMLSRSAFDALLDITHNPPSYVRFLFATTAVEKLPKTFLSRCIVLPCRKISDSLVSSYLKTICELEEIKISEQVSRELVKISNGSLRKILSLLEPISYLKTEVEMLDYLKIIATDKAIEIFLKVLAGKTKEAIDIWRELNNKGYDEKEFFRKFSEIFMNLFLIKIGDSFEEEAIYKKILIDYDLSFSLLINFWEIILNQTEALYAGNYYTIETALVMMSVLEEETDLNRKIKSTFQVKI